MFYILLQANARKQSKLFHFDPFYSTPITSGNFGRNEIRKIEKKNVFLYFFRPLVSCLDAAAGVKGPEISQLSILFMISHRKIKGIFTRSG